MINSIAVVCLSFRRHKIVSMQVSLSQKTSNKICKELACLNSHTGNCITSCFRSAVHHHVVFGYSFVWSCNFSITPNVFPKRWQFLMGRGFKVLYFQLCQIFVQLSKKLDHCRILFIEWCSVFKNHTNQWAFLFSCS